MPDESCRNCGGILIDYSKCTQCNKTITLICTSCGTRTLEQFHSYCISYKILTNYASMLKKSDNPFLLLLA